MQKIRSLLTGERFHELFRYAVIGVCTTLVNYLVYYLMARPIAGALFGGAEAITVLWANVSNVTAWVLSVAFAFVANKLWVFESKEKDRKTLTHEIGAFVAARLSSLGFEVVFVSVLLWLGGNDLIVKLISNIFVVIINYFFSKRIFKRKRPDTP